MFITSVRLGLFICHGNAGIVVEDREHVKVGGIGVANEVAQRFHFPIVVAYILDQERYAVEIVFGTAFRHFARIKHRVGNDGNELPDQPQSNHRSKRVFPWLQWLIKTQHRIACQW